MVLKKIKNIFSKEPEIITGKIESLDYTDEIDISDLLKKGEEEVPKLSVVVVKELRPGKEDVLVGNIRAGNILIIKLNPEEINVRPELKNTLEMLKSKIKDYQGKLYQISNIIIALPPNVNLIKFDSVEEES